MIYTSRYLLASHDNVIEGGQVLVEGGEIRAVGAGLSEANPHEPVRDLGNCAIIPGFVNAHSHVDPSMKRNFCDALNLWDWLERLGFRKDTVPDYESLLASATLGAAECALSGITCLGDSTISGASAEAMDAVGLRGIVYREVFGQSMGDGYSEAFAQVLDDARDRQSRVSERVKIGISPHAIYTSNRGVLELCRECAESNIPIAIHLAETSAETNYSLNGTGPLAEMRRRMGYEPMVTGMTPTHYLADVGLLREGVCLAHCVHVSDDEVEMIARSGAGVASCPRSNAFLGAGIAPITRLISNRAKVGLGTDSVGSCLRFDFFEEMRFALGLARACEEDAAVLMAKDVLRLATLGGAEALGLSHMIGMLEPGKRADFVAIDLSDMLPEENLHLAVISKSPSDVVSTVVDGVEIVRDGQCVTVNALPSFNIEHLTF